MKTYNQNSSVRKPMMYGGSGGSAMSAPKMSMGMGMEKDKRKKTMGMMGMMYGGKPNKRSR